MSNKLLVLGSSGLIGNEICRLLKDKYDLITPNSKELNLLDGKSVKEYFRINKPDKVILAAAYKAGVGEYGKYPVEFLNNNIQIQQNVISNCFENDVSRFVFLGASSIYPSSDNQVIDENFFGKGWVQKATEPYSLAKAVGTKMCEYYNQEYNTNYVVASLANVYGWCKNHYDTTSVIPAMIERFRQAAKNNSDSVIIWGTGETKRDFLYVRDCANAIRVILESDYKGLINVGTGSVVSINSVASLIAKIVGFEGSIEHDLSKPNGSQRSVLDISKLVSLGWRPIFSLEDGLIETIHLKEREELKW